MHRNAAYIVFETTPRSRCSEAVFVFVHCVIIGANNVKKEHGKWDPEAKIFLHGDSLGAATVLLMTGEDLPGAVKACIADSPYMSAKGEFEYVLKAFHLPTFPYALERRAFRRESGYDLDETDVLAAVKQSKTPTLFIHGLRDNFVPPEHSEQLAETCAAPCRRKTFPEASHCQSEFYHKDEYFETIKEFLKQYIS